MKSLTALVGLTILVCGPARFANAAENWPQWRGPQGNGVSDATNPPTEWSLAKNIVWKAPLPSWSGGTPVIWGDRVFVTSPSKSEASKSAGQEPPKQANSQPGGQPRRPGFGGRRPGFGGFGGYGPARDPGGQMLLLICLSAKDGAELWRRELDEGNELHRKGNNSSPSPVTDGKHVWALTGTGQVAAFDRDGNPVWSHNLQKEYGKFGLNWGYGSSPLLYDGKLLIQVLHGNNTDDPSYLIAFDAASGKVLWRQERPTDAPAESPDAYTTPTLVTSGDKTLVVVSGGDYVTAHDPESGKEVWRVEGLNPGKEPNYRIIASPVVSGNMVYAPSRKAPLLAIDVSAGKPRVAWTWEEQRGGPDVPTPVSDGKYFFMVNDQGIVTCVDVKTGKAVSAPKRTAEGTVSASPLLADGKLYITNESAVTTVVTADPELKVLATNELDGSYTLSSPVVAGNRLFLRTSEYLYCIGKDAK
jgi:outer membrane protein assembly factor BamB